MTKYLSRDALLRARPRVEEVDLPGLGKVKVRGLTATERGRIESLVVDVDPVTQSVRYNADKAAEMNILLAAYGLLDENGEPMFNPKDPNDLKALAEVDGLVIGRIADKVRELSGMGEEAAKKEQP